MIERNKNESEIINDSGIKIGLEVHMHLKTLEKLFCRCKIPKKTDKINSSICPICTGQPGSKPMLPNKEAMMHVIKLGLVMGSDITLKTNFQRKHYTWPDMPTGFQRTVSGGNIVESVVGGEFFGIKMTEIHLEENPAGWDPVTGELNYNRSGFPLAEIVTEPDFTSTKQLREWLEELILVGKYLGALDEDFGIKSDVNVSVKESGYSRVEIKNVNSIANIVAAAETEIKRQRKLAFAGEKIPMETRRYNEADDTTQFMRSKENAQDYMFTPEPDLPNVVISDSLIEKCKNEIPQMPWEKREKYSKFKFDDETVQVLVSNLYLTELFEHVLDQGLNPKEVGLFLRRDLMGVINYNKASFDDLIEKDIKSEISDLLELLGTEKIAYNTAQKIIEKLWNEKFDVKSYVKENGLEQVQDDSLIEKLVISALKNSPKAVEDHKNGNSKALNFVVGIVMKETKGTAKPQIVNKILQNRVKDFF